MKFDDIKHGDVFYKKNSSGLIGLWIIYKLESDLFHAFFWQNTSDKLENVKINKKTFDNEEYSWSKHKGSDNNLLGKFVKKIISEVFTRGVE